MKGASPPLVTIIIVNTNEDSFLLRLLESIYQMDDASNFEIIVIDNNSKRELPLPEQEGFYGITVTAIDRNIGFSEANNIGLRKAKGKYVLLLNPDTLLQEAAISQCIHYFENHLSSKIGAVGCRLKNLDGSTQKSFYGLASSIKKTIQENAFYIKVFGKTIKENSEMRDLTMHSQSASVKWLCGAFLLMNRYIVKSEEFYLDEDFFLYSDDVELGYRMKSKGYDVIYNPESSILHFGGGNKPYLKRFEKLTASEWLCMMKIHGKIYFICNQFLILINIFLDEALYLKNSFFKKINFTDKKRKIIRKKTFALWKKHTFKILFNYNRAPSFHAESFLYAD